jgi:superfamily II DNA or RNA helicase
VSEGNIPAADGAAGGAVVDIARPQCNSGDNVKSPAAPALRPYQADFVSRFEKAVHEGKRRILGVGPTGCGKTIIFAAIARAATGRHRRVLVLAHRRELIKQTSSKLYAVGVGHGIILSGWPTRSGERVQVASISTLHARAVRTSAMVLPPADLIIVDEAHHARARTYRRLIKAYPDAVTLGLTATPCRGDGRGLGNVFDVLIEGPSVAELIAAGYLVPTVVYAPTRPDLTGIRVERGDYVESQLAECMDQQHLVGDTVEYWLKLAERRPTVVFATGVTHSLHIRDQFRAAGVLAEHIDGSTPVDERDAILARLAAGTIEVVCNCAVLTEGWDRPEVSCLVLARPTKSLGLYLQMAGRVLRPSPGKIDALILDHAGAVFQHGFPDDPIEWTLAEDRRAENKVHSARGQYKAPELTTCPECSAVRFEGQPCPVCHWRPVVKAEAVEIAEGELGRVERNRSVVSPMHTADEQRAFYAQLLWIAYEKSYRCGWAAHKFKEKFGDWPRPQMRYAVPILPTDAVRAWVRSRQIAYAKAIANARVTV